MKIADEIAFWIVSSKFYARRMWVVAADATVRAKPNNLFAIDENGIDVIGTQTTRCAVESEALDLFRVGEVKNAAPIRAGPHVIVRARAQRHYGASRRIKPGNARGFAAFIETAFIFPALRANPQLAFCVGLERANEIYLGPRRHYIGGAVLYD